MSAFYDLASLVLVPSGYKASKVYAQKPLTTDGQLAFSRASTATRVNSAGLIETVSSNVPRLDYLNSSCPRLLLEPQRINLLTYSEQFDNAAWTKTQSSITANNGVSPDGYANADKLIANTTSNIHFANTAISDTAASWTYSIFAKAAGYDRLIMWTAATNFVGFNLTTGVVESTLGIGVTSANIQNYGNGWYRCSITSTSVSSGSSIALGVFNAAYPNGNVNPIFTGNGTDGILVYGAQFESGAYATSYIPTTTAAVTRLADACSKTGISSLIGQTEGTVFLEVDYSTLSGLDMFLSIRPDASNKVEVYRDGGTIYGEITASSSFALSASKAVGTHKIAFAYKSGSSALYIDGVLAGQSTTAFTYSATLADLFINQRSGGTFIEAANYKQALLFKTRQTNAQLAELTSL